MTSTAASVVLCGNASCAYRKKFGRPAEYRAGFTHCSDCGGVLVAEAEAAASTSSREVAASAGEGSSLTARGLPWKRLAITGLAPAAVYVVSRIPLPGVDLSALSNDPFLAAADANLTVGALWVTPFLLAFGLVEIAAAAVPGWRGLRTSGSAGRATLGHAAAVLGTVLTVLQAIGIATWVQSIGSDALFDPSFAPVVAAPGASTGAVITLTLTATAVSLAWLAGWISRAGIGNGWGVLLLCALGMEFVSSVPGIWFHLQAETLLPSQLALFVGAHVAAVFVASRLLRMSPGEPLRSPVGGITAAAVAPGLIGAAASVPSMFNINVEVAPDVWTVVSALLAIPIAVACAILWNQPMRVGAVVAGVRGDVMASEAARTVRLQLPQAMLVSAAFSAVLVVAPVLYSTVAVASGVALVATVTATAIVLDLWAELKARSTEDCLVAVWPLHQVYAIGPTVALLEAKGIRAFVRGERFRILFPFLESYLPAEVMVPEPDAVRAEALIRRALVGDTSAAPAA